MTAEDINKSLHRPLLSGNEYEGLFENTGCPVTELAEGNTTVAIQQMAKEAKKYAYQTKKLAPLFDFANLDEIVNTIQWFLYHHFQYKIDGTNQDLRTPSCAWYSRKEGFDCKTFSNLASSILLNLGIRHFLRRIKQNADDNAYTHVYVVIPISQNKKRLPKTATFLKDYLIIDGTIEQNIELPFIQKDDVYMEPTLPIRRLGNPQLNYNGLGCGSNSNCGCSNTYQSPDIIGPVMVASSPQILDPIGMGAPFSNAHQITIEAVENFYAFLEVLAEFGVDQNLLLQARQNMNSFIDMGIEPTIEQVFSLHLQNSLGVVVAGAAIAPASKITVAAVAKVASIVGNLFKKDGFFSKIFGKIDCWGGSAFDANQLNIARAWLTDFFIGLTDNINKAAFNGDLAQLSVAVADFRAWSQLIYTTYYKKRTETNWNSCSGGNMDSILVDAVFFRDTAYQALNAWVKQYFNETKSNVFENYTSKDIVDTFMGGVADYRTLTQNVPILSVKSGIGVIKGFELNQPLVEQSQNNTFDPKQYLESLKEVIAVVENPNPNTPITDGSVENPGNVNTYSSNNTKDHSKAGVGTILGIAGIAVLAIAASQTKKKKTA